MKNILPSNVSYESLVTLFSQAPVALSLIMGDNFIIHTANPKSLELWGKDELCIGKPLFEIFPELKSQGFEEIFNNVYKKGEIFKGDKLSIFLNKYDVYEEHFFDFIYSPVYNSQNSSEIIGVSVVATEVTDQVLSARKLKESEYKFEDLIKNSDYSIALYRSKDLIIELANDPMLKTWGKPKSVIGMKLEDALPELEGQPFIGLLKDIFETGETYTAKEDKVDLVVDGKLQTFYYNFSYKPLKNSQGEVYAIYNVAVDVTHLVNGRQEIQKNEQELRKMADSMPQIVWTTDHKGVLKYMNEKWFTFSKYDREMDLTESVKNMMKPGVYERVDQIWKECIQTGKPFEVECEFLSPNTIEEFRWFLARAVPSYNEKGEVKEWIGTFTDIDDFKKLQNQKDNFLGIASHELKTPLTSLKLYTQVIERNLSQNGDQKNAAIASKMDSQIELLNGLVRDLLDVTKIQKGQIQLNKSYFDFDDLIDDVVTEQQMASRHKILVEKSNVGKVFADRHRIAQVMSNLIGNATKYSPEAEEVHVKAHVSGDFIHFSVKDFGIGIPEEKQPKVFEQYYRVSGSKEHTFPGLGLGLYISSEIIKRSGGKIFVNSVEGKGSDFCFQIPTNKGVNNIN